MEGHMTLDDMVEAGMLTKRDSEWVSDHVDFQIEELVPFTDRDLRKFREFGYTVNDFDEWLEGNLSGSWYSIVLQSIKTNNPVSIIYCFESKAEAAMFKLTFCGN
jgi:hypothetical protein